MPLIVGYIIFLFLFSIYSYAILDPNITFARVPIWAQFRNAMVQLGYHEQQWSAIIFLIGIVGLFIFQYLIIKNTKWKSKIDVFRLSLLIGGVLLVSYPFLSHDLFNYIFDAKIATFYHQNPY